MSKQVIIDSVQSRLGGSKADAARAVDAVVGAIADYAGGGGRVSLPPLGTFALKHKAARQARNPRTGEPITIAAKDVIGFKPSKKG